MKPQSRFGIFSVPRFSVAVGYRYASHSGSLAKIQRCPKALVASNWGLLSAKVPALDSLFQRN